MQPLWRQKEEDRQIGNRRDHARAGGGVRVASGTKDLRQGVLSGLDGQQDAESESVPGFLLGQQEGL